ncbi:MAG: hypothetical protein HY560_06850 [Gemmatimonadetes bacterium]|nr:hypothetical protein [Gemmatimonadota bacterium]
MERVCAVLVVAAASLAGCQVGESPQQMQARMDRESAAFRTTLEGMQRSYERWEAAGQVDSIASTYMEQGRSMPPNEPAAVGRAAIRQMAARNAALYDSKLTLKLESAMANGPLGVDRGSYALQLTPKRTAPRGTPAVSDEGKYLVHWHQVNGQWLIADVIWNSNKPVMMPAASTPARRR